MNVLKKNKNKVKQEQVAAEISTTKRKKQKKDEIFNDGSTEIPKKKRKKHEGEENESANNGIIGTLRKLDKCRGVGSENATEEIRHVSGVVVSGKNVNDSKYATSNSFAESGHLSEVLECCKNFNKPSPIQSQSWPFLLAGRDFIGIAATGSGKTLAFGVPAITNVLSRRNNNVAVKRNPLCLVLSPTRELAQQGLAGELVNVLEEAQQVVPDALLTFGKHERIVSSEGPK